MRFTGIIFFLLSVTLLSFMNGAVLADTDEISKGEVQFREKGSGSSPSLFAIAAPGFFNRIATPERKAAVVSLASSYDPNFDNSSIRGTVAAIYDHGKLWDNVSSNNTFFKLEATVGTLLSPEFRTILAVNMLSVYYPEFVQSREFRPYLEAGIGAIYTDYRVDGQSYRHNFNPLLGIGTEISEEKTNKIFVAMRLHHVSNGGLGRDNQGVNSLLLQVGSYF